MPFPAERWHLVTQLGPWASTNVEGHRGDRRRTPIKKRRGRVLPFEGKEHRIFSMAKRIIMRIELTPDAKTGLQDFADHAGMTQFAITSRMVEWFATQPEQIQSAVLRRYPSEASIDVGKLILKRLASGDK
jgi:hypothetical protein